jgi:hypothetical protein
MTETSLIGPTLADFEGARHVVSRVADVTPMETARFMSEILGSPVYLKCENLQRTGSYKIRGAYNRLAQLTDEEKARGVVAASAGNHAQGVAFAARELGIAATIFMPVGVAQPKLQATRGYGADVVLRGTTVEEPLRAAAEFADKTGAVLIPPFDHIDVITRAPSAWRSSTRCPTSTPSSSRSAAAASSPASRARSSRRRRSPAAPCASSACRRPTPPRTRSRLPTGSSPR